MANNTKNNRKWEAMKKAARAARKSRPIRCSGCGEANPEHHEGYTSCCNEPLTYPDDPNYDQAERWYKASR